MAGTAADSNRDAILRGQFELGQRLKESDLGRRYDVTNIVIREAFQKLEGDGLVMTTPYRGRTVFTITAHQLPEMMLMRASQEAQAAFWAARLIDDTGRKSLRSALDRYQNIAALTYDELIRSELDFHRAIWTATGGDWLPHQIHQIVLPLLALPVQQMIAPFRTVEEESARIRAMEVAGDDCAHGPVADAILRGDEWEARSRMIRHLLSGSPVLEQLRRDFFRV
ncbi:MAG: GntR family transcriptional regulator [Bryobacteraceae bacterium]